jgi:hypothetical protein
MPAEEPTTAFSSHRIYAHVHPISLSNWPDSIPYGLLVLSEVYPILYPQVKGPLLHLS